MKFDEHHLKKIAKLSRMALSAQEITHLEKDLQKIVQFFEQLSKVDVSNIEPMSYAGDRALILREDEAHLGVGREGLKSSLGYSDGLVKVPRIIE